VRARAASHLLRLGENPWRLMGTLYVAGGLPFALGLYLLGGSPGATAVTALMIVAAALWFRLRPAPGKPDLVFASVAPTVICVAAAAALPEASTAITVTVFAAALAGVASYPRPAGFAGLAAAAGAATGISWHVQGSAGMGVGVLASFTAVCGAAAVVTSVERERRAREDLSQTRERLLGILAGSHAIAWSGEVLPDGTYIEHETHGDTLASFGFRAAPGREAGDIWMRHVHPEDVPMLAEASERHLRGESATITYRLVRGDGAVQWISEASHARLQPDGSAQVQGLCVDVTALHDARDALERTQRRLETVMAASRAHPFAGFLLPGGLFVEHYTGPNLEMLLGGPVPEGHDPAEAWHERIHPDDRDRYDQTLARAAEQGADHDSEYRLVGYDGIVRWVSVRAVCRPRGDGAVAVDGLAFDITSARMAADELERARILLGEITEASGAHAYAGEITTDGVFFEQYSGANLERLIGGPPPQDPGFWRTLVHPGDRDAYHAAILAALSGVAIDVEYRIVGLDGATRWVWERARAQSRGNGIAYVEGLVFDVTARRAAAAEARAAYDLLDRVDQGVYTLDIDSRTIRYANRAIHELVGERDSESLLTDADWSVHPDDRALFDAGRRTIELGNSWSGTYRVAADDGWRWLREHVACRRDGDRRIADGLVYDATVELETRQALDAVRAQMQIAMESVQEVLFSIEVMPDGDDRLLFASAGMEALLGGELPEGVDTLTAFRSRVHRDDVHALLELVARVRSGETGEIEVRLVGYDRVVRWVWIRVRPRTAGDQRFADGILSDVTARREAAAEIEHASRVDALTGLFNRRHGTEVVVGELARASRAGTPTGLVLLDVDRFKTVNDTYGHAVGDAVLTEVGRRIEASVRRYDTVVRWGGEEFIVLVPDADEQGAGRVAEAIRVAVGATPIVAGSAEVAVTASCGAAVVAPGSGTLELLTGLADQALYAAKRRGRDRVCLVSDLGEGDLTAEEPEVLRVAEALARWAAVREGVSELHAAQVADLSAKVARHLGLPASVQLRARLAGWLHDVGKITIPDHVLRPDRELTPDEAAVLRTHAEVGRQLMARTPGLGEAADGVGCHHEHWDGSGYPAGMAGEQIPIEARIVAAVDHWSAETESGRPRRVQGQDGALAGLRAAAGSALDPTVVDALIAVIGAEWAAAGERLRQGDQAA
jgi:diguanylate cyclase (GGDEF)-like protein